MSRRQAERSEHTRAALVRVARELFTEPGYAATPIEEVAERAGVTKGALYHHFRNKRDLFQAVFEEIEQELVTKVILAAGAAGDDVWKGMRLGVKAFLEASLDASVGRIVLIDGPSVLGWDAWKEIDDRYGFEIVRGSLQAAVDAGIIAKRPVDPLARLFLAALSEAAIQIARAPDQKRAMKEMTDAVQSLLDSMRVPSG
ncbi:MAG TPA: TetR/AcrR family transcriptional regulator [Actinomycetota bacterium]|jgi:AcrR family transcriptional regulator|nr:TetR/AcrR family transcriptional regulator [Actinomycetota bacterium]